MPAPGRELRPVTNLIPCPSANNNAFVIKFSPSGGALVYSTYLGGTRNDSWFYYLTVDRRGNAYLKGGSKSDDFPTKKALQSELSGSSDGFITKIASPVSRATVDLLLLADCFKSGWLSMSRPT
jgi:Beta-propeller repeat